MKSETRLDSVVFQLTPTRTRCDLVIVTNGKKEKVASGLLKPFLAHLKTAQEQIAKGGYSIMLEPDSGSDAPWFTKGTVERFVRFVSTPEVLERVHTIEAEILQIEEAIVIQSNDNLGLRAMENNQATSSESIEGVRPALDADDEKAIVLYKPEAHPPESNGSTTNEENSKVHLLRVLETRKTVLQKEQGMAFARAVAAGFDMEHMAPLVSFAECFGASRLMEACLRFMNLWKSKHETGQWLEIEAAEVMSSRSDFSTMNASGVMLSGEEKKQNEFREAWPESHGELASDSNGKASNDFGADTRPPMDSQVPLGYQEYFQGQFQHPMFHQWPIHSPPGAPQVFQPYPVQGMPYYPGFPGNGSFFNPSFSPMEDPRYNSSQMMKKKRHSMDSRDSNTDSDAREMGVSNTLSQDDMEPENDVSHGRELQKKSSRSGKKQSGMVVIRNINYITSKRQNASGSESETTSDAETDDNTESMVDAPESKHKNSVRSSRNKMDQTKSTDSWKSSDKGIAGLDAGGENWEAFQNCLLRVDDEDNRAVGKGMFAAEKEVQLKRRQNTIGGDPIVPHRQDMGDFEERRTAEYDTISGKMTRTLKAPDDELVLSHGGFHLHDGRGSKDGQTDAQLEDIEGGRGAYRRTTTDDFMIYRQDNQLGSSNSRLDPLAGNVVGQTNRDLDISSSAHVTDESFIVPLRSIPQDQVGTDNRAAIDIGSELPSALQKKEDLSRGIRIQLSCEPDDLSLMPERGLERESIGYDPAVDYEMQVHAEGNSTAEGKREGTMSAAKEGLKKSDKDKKSKIMPGGSDKRKMDAALRKGKPSKFNPSSEAQMRADRLRAFKADLQKLKKEHEEEKIKRLEALKRERQKRIAARGSSSPGQSPVSSQQTRQRLPTKLSPMSQKGSKFSDSEPGSLSPLQRLPIKSASVRSNDSQKTTKISRLNSSSNEAGNGLSRSLSSLPELKKQGDGVKSEPKASTARIRRLSEPKMTNRHRVSSVNLRSTDPISKPKAASGGPELKKISAIMNLDRTKAASLPELKVRTSKGQANILQNKLATKEMTQKMNASRSSATTDVVKVNRSDEKLSQSSNGDDNPVIEKTVVLFEHEKPPVPMVHASEERIEIRNGSYDEDLVCEKVNNVSEHVAIHARASPLIFDDADKKTSGCHLEEQLTTHEMATDYVKNELPKLSSSISSAKPYQAPYARVSSLEDPCTTNLEYGKALLTCTEEATTSMETASVHVSNTTGLNSLQDIPEALEKPRRKESSKGFRRLLKFGRKNHSSATSELNVESDNLSVDGSVTSDNAAMAASLNEVPTLKNLISQDETPTGATTLQKSSRSFSLLSPFRSKTSDKKLAT